MKKVNPVFITSILMYFLSCSLFGQKSTINYDLSSYKLPELKRHELEIKLDLNQNRSYSNDNTASYSSYSKCTSINFNFNPTYYYYLNTKRLQFESTSSIGPFSFRYYKNTNSGSESREINFTIVHYGDYRFYLKNKLFVEFDLNSGINVDQYYNKTNEEKNYDGSSTLTIPIKIGVGRIERVEDARLAVYILDDLKKNDKLGKEPSQDEITEFAQFLSKLQNERFFDSREKKIWALQQIDSFMVANNLLKQEDVLSISLINDNWDNADGPHRETGFRFSAGIFNGYSNSISSDKYEISDNDIKQNRFTYRTGITGEIVYEKPVNLYWQFSINDRIYVGPYFVTGTTTQNNNDYKGSETTLYANNYFNSGLGYYPNSRTALLLNMNLSIYYYKTKDTSEDALPASDEDKSFNFSPGISLTGSYYFSRQLQLTINTGFSHSYYRYDYELGDVVNKYNNGNVYFTLGLNYKIL
jgi:hypothetical protein